MSTATPERAEIEPARAQFRRLLAANPNYFGSVTDIVPDLGDVVVVEPKAGDTRYEELGCVAYSPSRDRIEATVLVKLTAGYSGGPCTAGSFEHVRFYVDYGAGWEDVGAAAINVHDLLADTDCRRDSTHPLSFSCGVAHAPRRDYCGRPVLPRVRAILSWNLQPPPNQPDWQPPWGNVRDCRIQIRPRRFVISDVLDSLSGKVQALIPPSVLSQAAVDLPDETVLPPLGLSELDERYRDAKVPAHRFALSAALSVATSAYGGPIELAASAQTASLAELDLSAVLKQLEDTTGDVSYEELYCLGLDAGLQSLVASFRVKQSNGYSGPPCSAGSTEYVAFWADWDDDCRMEYLGTVATTVHDYEDLGDGLCYAAILPVDLAAHRRGCDEPVLRRVRAVLSWNTPPSTTDPDDVPYWGNRIDRHVHVAPGPVYDGVARFTIVGGVAAQDVDLVSGLTVPGATLGVSTTPLPDYCPFAGRVVLHGPNDPALVGHQYRIRATNVDGGGSQLLTTPFGVVTSLGTAAVVTPDPVNGWVAWPTWTSNTTGVLGVLTPGTDDRWDFELELDVPGAVVDTARTRMDNTVRNVVLATDTVNAADLTLNTAGACKVPHGPVNGTFVARDRHFLSWSIGVLGGPGGPIPPIPVTVGIGAATQTPYGGTPFTLDFTNPLIAPCGYVVRLTVTDRAVVDSVVLGQHSTVDRGLCLE